MLTQCVPVRKFIVTSRHQDESVASYAKVTGCEDHGREIVATGKRKIQEFIERCTDPILHVPFDEAIDNHRKVVASIAEFVGISETHSAHAFPDKKLRTFNVNARPIECGYRSK